MDTRVKPAYDGWALTKVFFQIVMAVNRGHVVLVENGYGAFIKRIGRVHDGEAGQLGRGEVEQRFSAARMVENTIRVYEDVLGKRPNT